MQVVLSSNSCRWAGTLVQYGTGAWKVGDRGLEPHFQRSKMFLPCSLVKIHYCGEPRDRDVVCSNSDRHGSHFESCVWRAVSPHSSHHPQEVLLAKFSLYVHKCDLKPIHFKLMLFTVHVINSILWLHLISKTS